MEQNFDEIVISGVAGRFPECENVEEFCKSLFEGNDLVTENDRRFKPGKNTYFSKLKQWGWHGQQVTCR